MNLSLGNMLGERMAINPDGLSLDLAFAADATLTARKGPTPTFTRASIATYVGSNGGLQSAAINEARFDHDPVTLACKGLLIEESRTNLFTDSNPNNWGAARLSQTPTSGLGFPNNASILEGTSLGSQYIYRGTSITVGLTYTISCRVKAGTATTLGFTDFLTGAASRNFNADTGEWPSSGGSLIYSQYASTELTNGWHLISFAYTPTGATGTRNLGFQVNDSPQVIGATFFIDTPQLEAGAFPTSYIPTTGAALTRSADVCSVTTAGWSNAGNDTMLAEYFVSTATSGVVIVEGSPVVSWMSLSFSTSNRQRNIYRHGGTSTRFDATTDNNSVSLININKTALTSGEQLALNGSLSQTVASEIPQADISTSLSIGSRGNGASLFLNGHIARIKYFKKRLANAKLQAITT